MCAFVCPRSEILLRKSSLKPDVALYLGSPEVLSSPSSATAKKGIFLESAEGTRSGASDFDGFLIPRLGVAILVACSSVGTGA